MAVRVALLSGGKDSLYAAMKYWPPDYGVVLVYEFPLPSPHLVNLGSTLNTLLLTGIPVLVVKLEKGREFEQTVDFLRRLSVDELIAGDVYIEDHLKYMEKVASEAGAVLREPLWGEDPEELVYRIIGEEGFEVIVTGADKRILEWLGKKLSKDNVEEFVEYAKKSGVDPLGEKGEYHTLVLRSPVHREPLPSPRPIELISRNGYWVLRVA